MLYEEGLMGKISFIDFSWDNGKLIGCLKNDRIMCIARFWWISKKALKLIFDSC